MRELEQSREHRRLEALSSIRSGKEVFMYTGKPYDSATGLYYEGARYYDPTTGRFITQDSYAGDRTDPMGLNLYVYGRDDPERYVDPTGHYFVSSAYSPPSVKPLQSAYVVTTGTPVVTVVPAHVSRSPDAMLTSQGSDQYASGLTGSLVISSKEVLAWVVTVGVVVLSGVAIYQGLRGGAADSGMQFATNGIPGPAIGPGTAGGFLLLAKGDLAMVQYDYSHGPNATPTGALNTFYDATYSDVVVHDIATVASWLSSLV